MSQFDRFIDNLIEMRSHYNKLLQQSDRFINLAQDSLAHINALLVNELSGNQSFIENLTQMKLHYQSIIEENDRALSSERAQLNHINALLAEQLVTQQGDKQAIFLQASPAEDDLAIKESFKGVGDFSKPVEEVIPKVEEPEPLESFEGSLQTQSSIEDFSVASTPATELNDQKLPIESDSTTEQVVDKSGFIEDENLPAATVFDDFSQKPTPGIPGREIPVEFTKKARKPLKQPLLPEYEHLSKSEAVEKLLQEETGNILYVDDIIRYLYGELATPTFKVEKNKLYNTLNKGVENGLWDKVPGRSGCYTSVLEQAIKKSETEKLNTKQQEIPASTLIEALSPAYHGLKLTQAVEKVLQGNPGVAMNSEKIAQILFDKAEENIFAAAKSKIGKVLWAGANQGRWQGVPGKLGVYTVSKEK
jgi:hypothetical protein